MYVSNFRKTKIHNLMCLTYTSLIMNPTIGVDIKITSIYIRANQKLKLLFG